MPRRPTYRRAMALALVAMAAGLLVVGCGSSSNSATTATSAPPPGSIADLGKSFLAVTAPLAAASKRFQQQERAWTAATPVSTATSDVAALTDANTAFKSGLLALPWPASLRQVAERLVAANTTFVDDWKNSLNITTPAQFAAFQSNQARDGARVTAAIFKLAHDLGILPQR